MKEKDLKCFSCGGICEEVVEDFPLNLPNKVFTVPNLIFFRCLACGDEIIPPESSRRVDKEIIESNKLNQNLQILC